MTVNGWSDEGTPRLFCAEVGGSVGSVTTFLGQPWPPVVHDPALPTISLGTADASMEVWALRRVGNSPGGDEIFQTGLFRDTGTGVGRGYLYISWDGNADQIEAGFSRAGLGPGGGPKVGPLVPDRRGLWNYYVLNADRDGSLEVFIDLASKGTVAIATEAAAPAAAGEFHPLQSDHSFIDSGTLEDWFVSGAIFPVMIGGVAVHNRLLTAAERQASFVEKTVRNLGSGITYANYSWTSIDGETGWDSNMSRCLNSIRAGLQVPAAMPQGANGTVRVLDQSGNNRHWNLRSAADYTLYDAAGGAAYNAEDGKWPMAFGAAVGV